MSQMIPPPGLPQQAWPAADRPEPNTPAVLALVFGLLTLVLSVLATMPAIIYGVKEVIRAGRQSVRRGKGMAIVGIVLAVVIPSMQFAVLVAYPAVQKARLHAKNFQSMANLRCLATGVIMYAQDHKAYLPPDLQSTYVYVKTPKVFRHPANKRPLPNPQNLDAESDYVYVYARKTDPATEKAYQMTRMRPASQCILLHEKFEFARSGRIAVACLDGHVERMTLAEFNKQLAKQQAAETKP